jgi:hypothetical protein
MEQVRFHVTMPRKAVDRVDAEAARQTDETQNTMSRGAILAQLAMRNLPETSLEQPPRKRSATKRYPVPKKRSVTPEAKSLKAGAA